MGSVIPCSLAPNPEPDHPIIFIIFKATLGFSMTSLVSLLLLVGSIFFLRLSFKIASSKFNKN